MSKKNWFTIKKVVAVMDSILLTAAMLTISNSAFAADNLSTGLCSVWHTLAGTPLFIVGMLSIFGGGMAIIFGGEMTDMLKKVATTAVVVGIILSAQLLLQGFFPSGMC